MKKIMKSILMGITTGMTMAAMAVTAYAGQWVSDSAGWWYQNDNGTYPASAWQWIDGNGDGSAECYYFDHDGYLVTNSEVDGYTLNESGAWIVDGAVQTKATEVAYVQETQTSAETVTDSGKVKTTLFDMEPTASSYWRTKENASLTSGDNWELAMSLCTWAGSPYATFQVDGQYSTLTFDAGAGTRIGEDGYLILGVYGDDDELLYSETYEKDESPRHAVVDISGQEHIRLLGTIDGRPGTSTVIYLKGLELR